MVYVMVITILNAKRQSIDNSKYKRRLARGLKKRKKDSDVSKEGKTWPMVNMSY